MQTLESWSLWFRKVRASKWTIYTAVNIAVFTDMYLEGLITPILPFTLEERVHIRPEDVQKWTGLLVGLYGGGNIIGSPLAGYLADNFTARRTPHMLGLIALIASTIMYSLGRSIAVLVAARLCQGVSSGFTYSIGTAVVADTIGNTPGGRAMGFLTFSVAAGMVVGPVCGGTIYYHFGYQAVFISGQVLMGLDLVFWLLMIERKHGEKPPLNRPGTTQPTDRNPSDADEAYGTFEQNCSAKGAQEEPNEANRLLPSNPRSSEGTQKGERDKHSSFSNFLVLLSKPRMLAALLGAFMQDFISNDLSSTLPLRMKTLFNFNSQSIGICLLLLQLANFISPLLGALSDKVGAKLTMSAGFVVLTPLLILLRLINHDSTSQIALLSVLLSAIGLGNSLVLSPIFTEVKAVVDKLQAQQPGILGGQGAYAMSFALMNMSYGIGSLTGPIIGSTLVERIGWGDSSLVIGVMCAICIVPSLYAAGGRAQMGRLRVFTSRE